MQPQLSIWADIFLAVLSATRSLSTAINCAQRGVEMVDTNTQEIPDSSPDPDTDPAPKLTTLDGSHLLGRTTRDGKYKAIKIIRVDSSDLLPFYVELSRGTSLWYRDDGTVSVSSTQPEYDLMPIPPAETDADILGKWQDVDSKGNPVTLLGIARPYNTLPRIVGYMGEAICNPVSWDLDGGVVASGCNVSVCSLVPKASHA